MNTKHPNPSIAVEFDDDARPDTSKLDWSKAIIGRGARKPGEKHEVRIDGVDVVCVLDAKLFEISYLHGHGSGAMKQAFATTLDLNYFETLQENCSGGTFVYQGAAVGVSRALLDLFRKTS